MAIIWKCVRCDATLGGEAASNHYMKYPTHMLIKVPSKQNQNSALSITTNIGAENGTTKKTRTL
jgi:hypothetical protein